MTKLEEWASAIADEYDQCENLYEAMGRVKDHRCPDADLNILWGMWLAIDAYSWTHYRKRK
jgi:hypothetical protein